VTGGGVEIEGLIGLELGCNRGENPLPLVFHRSGIMLT